jgi:hypothetical protein
LLKTIIPLHGCHERGARGILAPSGFKKKKIITFKNIGLRLLLSLSNILLFYYSALLCSHLKNEYLT